MITPMNTNTNTTDMIGTASGKKTCLNVCQGDAPSIDAALSKDGSILSKEQRGFAPKGRFT